MCSVIMLSDLVHLDAYDIHWVCSVIMLSDLVHLDAYDIHWGA